MTQENEIWTLNEQVAHARSNAIEARVDISRPQLGVLEVQLDSRRLNAHLLKLAPSDAASTWPAQLIDAYVRGSDLVATYAGDASWPYSPQVYWSAAREQLDSESVPSLGLMVSIQTNLLDTHPRLDVLSSLRSAEVLLISLVGDDLLVDSHIEGVQGIDPRTSACGVLWRFEGDAPSYAEVMPTTDFRQLAVERLPSGEVQSRWQLFAEFLEKGVIRRARLESIFVPRENDVQLVAECCRAYESRPLPLTT